jgi:hypothetical protein
VPGDYEPHAVEVLRNVVARARVVVSEPGAAARGD